MKTKRILFNGLLTLLLLASAAMFASCTRMSNAPVDQSTEWVPPPADLMSIQSMLPANAQVPYLANNMRVERYRHEERLILGYYALNQRISKVGFEVQFPPFSVPSMIMATIDIPDDNYPIADFGPHPYSFNGNVEIRIPIPDNTFNEGDSLAVFYWNGYTQTYENMNGVLVDHNTMSCQTNHFSRYLIAKITDSGMN